MNDILKIADAYEREAALDPSRSFIVQAPAGSGKTELLMQRFLNLLSYADKPEEILALTFTRKAAGEMQNRIIGAMERARSGAPPKGPHEEKTLELAAKALARDNQLGWDLLENPGRLKVQTIDSFCSTISRQLPVLSRMGKGLSITEDPAELYREAALRTLALVEEDSKDGEAVRKALRHLDNSVIGLSKRLVIMLGNRDQWLRHVKRDIGPEDLRALLEKALKDLVEEKLKGIRDAFPEIVVPDIVACARYAGCNMAETDSPIRHLFDLKALPEATADAMPEWRGLRELLLTSGNTVRKALNKACGFPSEGSEAKGKKAEFKTVFASLEDNSALITALSIIQDLPGARLEDDDWEILEALVRLLPIAERRLVEVFSEQGQVDFQAISLSALSALGTDENPTDLMLSLDMRIKHILVDEYQDTSRVQLELLKALTRGWTPGDGRTLFVVGDPMQSVYLFREADVGLFLDARISGIGGVELTPLTLKCNFRSQANIVEWVNDTFTAAFPETEDILTGSIRYSPSKATRPATEGRHPLVCLFEERDDADEARRVTEIIKSVPEGESVAVLCRSRSHLEGIVEALKKEAIPFRAQEMDALKERTVIQDLFALSRALAHPCDRVAWLAILRAPWCGITNADLYRLCTNDNDSALWTLMNDPARLSALSKDGRTRLERAADKLGKALSLRGRLRPGELLEGLWIDLGGPATVTDDASMEDAEAFFGLVEDVTRAGEADLERLAEKMNGLYASHGKKDGVTIDLMTVHRAKGLEFDHVILPGLGKKSRAADKKLLLWMERGDDLLLAPIEKKGGEEGIVYRLLKSVEKDKNELEKVRVFYVAATRAKKQLYLFGHIGRDEDGAFVFEKASFLSTIKHALREDMLVQGSAEGEDASEGPTLSLKRLPSDWSAPEPVATIETGSAADEVNAGVEPEFYWAGETVKHLGTVVHRYMCTIARQGLDKWGEALIEKRKDDMAAELRSLGLSMKEAKKAAPQAVAILRSALNDEKGRWILKGRAVSEVELPVTGVIKNDIVHAVIDRTFVEGDVRWIIDYKTSLHEGGSVKEFLSSEKDRYRAQLERYEEILKKGGETREIRKGLYYPALKEFIEW